MARDADLRAVDASASVLPVWNTRHCWHSTFDDRHARGDLHRARRSWRVMVGPSIRRDSAPIPRCIHAVLSRSSRRRQAGYVHVDRVCNNAMEYVSMGGVVELLRVYSWHAYSS